MKAACFTSHRKIMENISLLSERLYEVLEKYIANELTDFYIGGAIGFDTVAALTVLELREKYPFIKLHLVLPCPPEEQSENMSDSDRKRYNEIVSEQLTEGCMKARNARLVEYAEICFCYYNEKKVRSGTGQTVRMALRKGIDIVNLFR